ncbi:MAG: glycosyltransferase [Bacteroidaceae bacterium]|nr:glycosyltransferase [Bacteroidaceae bacterium]
MIFARDKSQMCNNLLQFAHVYAYGREHGRHVLSMRFSYKYPYFHIRHTKHTSFILYLVAKIAAALRIIPTANYKPGCNPEALERIVEKHRNVVVAGWEVRYYDLFLKYRKEICELFRIDEAYTLPVKAKMRILDEGKGLRLGLHIRRGDYAQWADGHYFYDDETYASYVNAFARMHPTEHIHVYMSTNDTEMTEERMSRLVNTGDRNGSVTIHLLGGNPPEDLFMLSECDAIIGPHSTFSLVAAMYRDIPFCRMDRAKAETLSENDFKLFDYWFRLIGQ